MKTAQLHALICEHIPQITFIDNEINDIVEAECTLWQQEDCTCIIDFGNKPPQNQQLLIALKQIATQITWLNQQRDAILQAFSQESGLSSDAATLQYVAFWAEDEQHIFCDFALNTPQLQDKIAEMSIEDHKIVFNGIENI